MEGGGEGEGEGGEAWWRGRRRRRRRLGGTGEIGEDGGGGVRGTQAKCGRRSGAFFSSNQGRINKWAPSITSIHNSHQKSDRRERRVGCSVRRSYESKVDRPLSVAYSFWKQNTCAIRHVVAPRARSRACLNPGPPGHHLAYARITSPRTSPNCRANTWPPSSRRSPARTCEKQTKLPSPPLNPFSRPELSSTSR